MTGAALTLLAFVNLSTGQAIAPIRRDR